MSTLFHVTVTPHNPLTGVKWGSLQVWHSPDLKHKKGLYRGRGNRKGEGAGGNMNEVHYMYV
jgi:hypothetical protein